MPDDSSKAEKHFHLRGIGDRAWHYGVWPVLRLFASDDLSLYRRRLRPLVTLIVVAAIVALPLAFFFNPVKVINVAGLLFDLAGVLRLFLFERITADLQPFLDEKEYPHGPPSVAMRELVMPEASPNSTDSPHLAHFYYEHRGVLYLFIGFSLQLVATLMS
jgi:hypothetical protein